MSSNNGFRSNTNRLLIELRELSATLEKTPAEELHVSCVNCTNWHQIEEYCMKYQQRPPARIIAFACPDWFNLDEDVPF